MSLKMGLQKGKKKEKKTHKRLKSNQTKPNFKITV